MRRPRAQAAANRIRLAPGRTNICVRSSASVRGLRALPASQRTREYIIAQLKALGVPVTQQAFVAKTPIGEIPMVNLIATIPGARKERIAITGHYDTKLFREFRFVGANDGGSSTAFLIELARVLKARANAFTIELIFFDGEEATLRDWGLEPTTRTAASTTWTPRAKPGRCPR